MHRSPAAHRKPTRRIRVRQLRRLPAVASPSAQDGERWLSSLRSEVLPPLPFQTAVAVDEAVASSRHRLRRPANPQRAETRLKMRFLIVALGTISSALLAGSGARAQQ